MAGDLDQEGLESQLRQIALAQVDGARTEGAFWRRNSRSLRLTVCLSAFFCFSAAAAPASAPQFIQQVDLIHFSHTDYGFTDHPAVCRDMQRRYLGLALDAARASANAPEGARFKWTAETTIAVNDW